MARRTIAEVLRDNIWATVLGLLTLIVAITALILPLVNHPSQTVVSTPPVARATATATSLPLSTATTAPTLTPSPAQASATDWGTLTGNPVTVNKTLPCGGCYDPILVKIVTIQIDKPNNEMTWTIRLSAPTATQENGYTEASFPQFTLNSDTASCPANMDNSSPSDFQAKFPCLPDNTHIYTLAVTLSYHKLTGGLVSIQDFPIYFQPVTMSFHV